MRRPPLNTETGNIALYALLLFPVALLLGTIAVDVSGWNALRDKLQQEADRLAFQSLGALPNEAAVRTQVLSAANELTKGGVAAEISFPSAGGSAVGVTLEAQYRTAFDFLLGSTLKSAFRVRRTGVAAIVPGDFVLIVADGGTLRPRLLPSAVPARYTFSSWGDSIDWPASRYFECVTPPVISEPNALGWSWWNDWSDPEFRRWATQSCFNPVLTPLKLAAIGLAESLLQYRANRIALLFTPGEATARGWRAARHIHSEADSTELYRGQVGGFPSAGGRIAAQWGNYLELERFLGDEICMLLTRPEASLSTQYEFPEVGDVQRNPSCNEPLASPPCGTRHFATGHFAECYLESGLSLRDAVYWNAAKLPIPGFSARPDILASLRQAWAELTDERSFGTERALRGNLSRTALRQVFVLTDYLPPVTAELSELLTAFRSRGIEVIAVPFFHEGLLPAETDELDSAIAAWKALATANGSTLRVSSAASANELAASAAPRLLADALQFALRS